MSGELLLAALALLASGLAALYARWSAAEARKANDIGRLNALLTLRTHYLALMQHQANLAEVLRESQNGFQTAQNTYADLDTKLREVSREVDELHVSIVSSHT